MEWLITLVYHTQPSGFVSQGCSARIFPEMLSIGLAFLCFFLFLWGIFVSCKIESKQQPPPKFAAVWAPSQEGRQCCGSLSPLSLQWHRTVFVAVAAVGDTRQRVPSSGAGLCLRMELFHSGFEMQPEQNCWVGSNLRCWLLWTHPGRKNRLQALSVCTNQLPSPG